jgi:pyruvate formate lyase activating enzyme
VTFFVGCNFRCRFCFNAPLLEFSEKYLSDLEGICDELEKQAHLIEGVIVTGGEPTLQPEPLIALGQWVQKNNLLFGLMTNGTRVKVLRKLLKLQLLDYLAVDIKTIPQVDKYAKITQNEEIGLREIKDTVALTVQSDIHYEFRTTLVPGIVYKSEDIRQISEWVGAENFVLQIFRPTETVLDPALRQVSFTEEELATIREVGKQLGIQIR